MALIKEMSSRSMGYSPAWLESEAQAKGWQLVKRVHDECIYIYDRDNELVGQYMIDEERMKTIAERSRIVGVQITFRPSDQTYNLGVFVDGKPERNYKFSDPMTLPEAMMFVAAEMRIEGNKWDINGLSPPEKQP